MCNKCYFDDLYEYCPINDIILISNGNKYRLNIYQYGV